MNPHQVTLVRQSWAQVQALGPAAAALFYEELFALNPRLRGLFHGDLVRQGERLLAILDTAVEALERPAQLQPALRALGRRHVGYGVEPAHYDQVGQALLATLALGLGTGFTAELKAAWLEVYGFVHQTMLAAAAETLETQTPAV